MVEVVFFFFFSSRRRHTRCLSDWSSDVCSSDLPAALGQARDDSTVITNVMTGRPARGVANRVMREVGPISPDAPAFPHAATGLAPLKAAAEKLGKVDFTNLWAGQALRLGREMPAADLTQALAGAALARLSRMAG